MTKESKQIIATKEAAQAIGPYSQAVKVDNMVFTSGQIPFNAQGELIGEGDIASQTKQVFHNLKAILNSAGGELEHIVKCTCFLKDMNQFAEMNAIYGEFFSSNPPARSTVEVSRLPKNVLVEIEAVAILQNAE